MTATSRKREVFANPFFVTLMLASVVFVVMILAYLMSAPVLEPSPAAPLANSESLPQPPRNAASLAFAMWLDRYAPWVLAIDFGIMLVTGVLAMVTDPWFSPKNGRRGND